MNTLQLILLTVRSLATVVNNPALGGGSSLRLAEASELLNTFGALLERGQDGYEDLREFAELVKRIAAEGRAPTPNEWASLRERAARADEIINNALEEALGEEEDGLEDLAFSELVQIAMEEHSIVLPENIPTEDAVEIIREARSRFEPPNPQ